ncbi:MAG: DNA translocase FtsK 4TM domain-containing protein [Alphaproteobacteria bacterium]|nr:DNA translocase FtsK 4TM domain-containing protein [Alphaproteobacteria bacterium]
MTHLEKHTFLPAALKVFFRRLTTRCIGLFLVGSGILLTLALATYNPADPSWNTATGGTAANMLGSVGAVWADLLWQSFGLGAVLFPISLAAWGLLVFRLKWHKFQFFRILSLIPTLFLLLVLFSALPEVSFSPVLAGFSGAIMPAFYLPLRQALIIAHLSYLEYILLPVVFIAVVFSLASTLGIPFYLVKRWISSLGRLVRRLSLFLWRKIRRIPSQIAEEPLKQPADELPQSLFAEQGELKLEETLPPSQAVPAKQPRPAKPSPLKSIKEQREYVKQFHLPKLDLLAKPKVDKEAAVSRDYLEKRARQLENVLEEYGVKGEIVNVRPGPVVTLFELEPAPGIKTTRVINLADDIARSMSALSVRIAVIPGQSVIGIEMPNEKRADVYLKELVSSDEFKNSDKPLLLALGKDIGGKPSFADLAKMPHLLVAGTTGSGKSVAINTMILSLVYRLTPDQVRLIMVDPKMLELSVYNGIPHLLTPVVTDPKKAVLALNWAVREMDQRYSQMSELGVRNIDGYNKKVAELLNTKGPKTRTVLTGYDNGEPIYEEQPLNLKPFPYIVVIVDEMADLMITAGKEIETAVQRIAQKARAAGIHLILATQRPSVDVITGTIKSNFPERISFRLTTKIDSRTILGEQGAEQLLGRGDMLYLAQGQRPVRLHGPFVSDAEVEAVTAHLRLQGVPEYEQSVTEEPPETDSAEGFNLENSSDASLYDQAVAIILRDRKVSTSYIQRQLRIGYNRAADLIDQMEAQGVISAPNHAGKREILVPDNR